MDYAATTPMDEQVLEAVKPYLSKRYGNASSIHSYGLEARKALEDSRHTIADLIKAKDEEIIFTGSGTESNNLAIKGVAFANRSKGRHIVTSDIEHDAVLEPCKWVREQGFEVSVLPVDRYGLVDVATVENVIRKDTILVSIMHANNEIGTIEPIAEIGKICHDRGVYLHSDAVQTFGKVPIDAEKMNVDLLSMSAHKLYGPKGVGCLYVRRGVKIEPLVHGGGHEFGLRSSTENVAGIVGFAKAAELRKREMSAEVERLTRLRDVLIRDVLKIGDVFLNGHPRQRLPNNANFWFKSIEGESLVLHLDMNGIAASTGSACSSKSLEPSHVLMGIGLKHEQARGSLRLTLGKHNSIADVDYVVGIVAEAVDKLRAMSPLE